MSYDPPNAQPRNAHMTAEALRREWQEWSESFSAFMQDIEARRIPYLSHSKVATVERCPRCYHKQYVLGEAPASEALTTGLLFHEAAAAFYAARRAGHSGAPATDARQLVPQHPSPDQQPFLDNAVATLRLNVWEHHAVVGVEELFFMDLAPDLPPVIGVIDLILRAGNAFVVVDHKTSKRFGDPDGGQLALYADYVRRAYGVTECTGAFDEYRLVPNLQRVRTPAFRRTPTPVPADAMPALVNRYRNAQQKIARIRSDGQVSAAYDCWYCNPRSERGW